VPCRILTFHSRSNVYQGPPQTKYRPAESTQYGQILPDVCNQQLGVDEKPRSDASGLESTSTSCRHGALTRGELYSQRFS
jgi:hypothetical protein